jgi:capsular exopolysaccharide synthesis family protein
VEPAQVIEALRRSWWLVLLGALLGLAGAGVANATSAVTYQAQAQLFVSFADQSDSSANALSGAQFTLQRVKSYTQVATSDQVLNPVVRELRLPITGKALAADVTASNPLDTVLIQLSVTNSSASRAAAVANAVAVQFGQVVEELERPPAGGDSPVKVSVTQPASVPTIPISPRRSLNLALGLMAGLGLGVGGSLLRARLDTTVKSSGDVEALTGAVPIGVVPADNEAKANPLVLHDTGSPRAEAFRALRTNLQFADVDHPPRVIVVTSPMAGDGKSTSACNVALTLALNGSRVVLIEADLRRPLACDYLGLDNTVGLTNVLAGQLSLDEALVSWNRGLLDVLPSGAVPPNPSELLGSHQMGVLLEALRQRYDYLIIDTAPLLPVTDAAVLSTLADGALLVLRHGTTTREHAERAVQSLTSVNGRLLGTVLNFAPRRRKLGKYAYEYGSRHREPAGREPRPERPGQARYQSPHQAPEPRDYDLRAFDQAPAQPAPQPGSQRPPSRVPARRRERAASPAMPEQWASDPGDPLSWLAEVEDQHPDQHPYASRQHHPRGRGDTGEIGIGPTSPGRHSRH